jgi:hypothetical protein
MKVTVPGIATVDPVVASAPGYTGRWSWLYWYSMLNELMSVIKFVGKESLLPARVHPFELILEECQAISIGHTIISCSLGLFLYP